MTEEDVKRMQDQLDLIHNFGEKVGKITKTVVKSIIKNIWSFLIILLLGVVMLFGGLVKGVEKK